MLVEAHVLNGRLEEAAAVAVAALDTARRVGRRGVEAWVLRTLGDISAAGAPPDLGEAEQRYREALDLARQLGMRPLVAHCHLGLGKLYRRTGKRDQAQEHLATATAMYREMDMRFWLEQAEAETRE
jgi:sugar phosphate isomerase/epimerase